jgi:hypothetical protein
MTNNFSAKTKELRPKLERLVYLISELRNHKFLNCKIFTIAANKICHNSRLFYNLRRFCRIMQAGIKLCRYLSVKAGKKICIDETKNCISFDYFAFYLIVHT